MSLADKPLFSLTKTVLGKPRPREYHFTGFSSILEKRILALNLHISSKKKLEIQYPDSGKVTFTDDWEDHVLRFETYSQKEDWLLTDIDFALAGNPYFS